MSSDRLGRSPQENRPIGDRVWGDPGSGRGRARQEAQGRLNRSNQVSGRRLHRLGSSLATRASGCYNFAVCPPVARLCAPNRPTAETSPGPRRRRLTSGRNPDSPRPGRIAMPAPRSAALCRIAGGHRVRRRARCPPARSTCPQVIHKGRMRGNAWRARRATVGAPPACFLDPSGRCAAATGCRPLRPAAGRIRRGQLRHIAASTQIDAAWADGRLPHAVRGLRPTAAGRAYRRGVPHGPDNRECSATRGSRVAAARIPR